VHGLDHALLGAVVTDSTPCRLDPRRQRRFADEAIAPHVVEQLVLRDDTIPMLDEVGEDAEDLRLHGDGSAGAAQLEHVGVEVECSERVDQRAPSSEAIHTTRAAEHRHQRRGGDELWPPGPWWGS
jgi:hypothetical protein